MILALLYYVLFKVCILLIIIAHWNTLYKTDVEKKCSIKDVFNNVKLITPYL